MEPHEIFMREDVMERPRLLFQFRSAWQSTPAALSDKTRAAIVAETPFAQELELTAEEVISLKAHYCEVFEPAAFDEALLPRAASDATVLVPPSHCPLADARPGEEHTVMVDKKARETQLRLFGMRGVRNVRRATASCFCGAVLYVSEWRESATAPRQFYADAHKRDSSWPRARRHGSASSSAGWARFSSARTSPSKACRTRMSPTSTTCVDCR